MTHVLVPGAGGQAWDWHRVVPLLDDAIAVQLPTDDPGAGLQDYGDAITAAAGDRERVTLVAHSLGAFSAPLATLDVERIILVAPMIPAPGETFGEWWDASGQTAAGAPPFDPVESFYHDVPAAIREQALRRGESPQPDKPLAEPWPLPAWPDVPTRVIACRHDRLFPLEFMRRLARDRLGVEAEVIDTGHMAALARPQELARTMSVWPPDVRPQPPRSSCA
jgi:pimeloyl-ACP methyl ester carboxylesterase